MSTKEPMNDIAVSDTCAFAMHLPELARQQHAPAVILAPMSAQLAQNVAQCHWTEIDMPRRATSATTSTMAAIRACFHLPVKKKSVLFEITPAGTPIATVDMSMWRYVDARRISTSSAISAYLSVPPPARESNQTWTHTRGCLRDCRGCRHGRSDIWSLTIWPYDNIY